MPYRLKNGWKAKDKDGKLKKQGEIIDLNKKDVDRLLALGMIEKVSVVVEKDEEKEDADDKKDEK